MMESNAGGVSKNCDSRPISGFIACCRQCTAAPDCGKLVALIIAGNRRRLLFMRDGRRSVYDVKPQRYVEDNRTEFNCTQW